ncbi:YrhB domain-containing protein [Kitasatospora viridis]|uniref:Immunity protein 35 of polymorphic toxin system n=1 Tax=Kitasatospora viridis TaxID=281105 RepID=A0A561TW77_9ACTN|nr:YrhB domain-containing protein [Kitasatospora viridis]TWF91365.1 immunity protein 35 of polymorphic toxin system [Kitasatospora viridis]
MVTKERAVELVEALLLREHEASPWLPELGVIKVEEHALGWLVFLQGVEYIRTRRFEDMLIGQGPYLVDRQDGSIHHIPVTTYVREGWEALYREHLNPAAPPEGLVTVVAAVLRSDGALAAMRYLRKQAPKLGLQDAKDYVLALQTGSQPSEQLVSLTQQPEESPYQWIETLAGPAEKRSG